MGASSVYKYQLLKKRKQIWENILILNFFYNFLFEISIF